jgi:hypothetical protein
MARQRKHRTIAEINRIQKLQGRLHKHFSTITRKEFLSIVTDNDKPDVYKTVLGKRTAEKLYDEGFASKATQRILSTTFGFAFEKASSHICMDNEYAAQDVTETQSPWLTKIVAMFDEKRNFGNIGDKLSYRDFCEQLTKTESDTEWDDRFIILRSGPDLLAAMYVNFHYRQKIGYLSYAASYTGLRSLTQGHLSHLGLRLRELLQPAQPLYGCRYFLIEFEDPRVLLDKPRRRALSKMTHYGELAGELMQSGGTKWELRIFDLDGFPLAKSQCPSDSELGGEEPNILVMIAPSPPEQMSRHEFTELLRFDWLVLNPHVMGGAGGGARELYSQRLFDAYKDEIPETVNLLPLSQFVTKYNLRQKSKP